MLQRITAPLILTSAISATSLRSEAEHKHHFHGLSRPGIGDTVVDPKCCTVGYFFGMSSQYCLGDNERNSAHEIGSFTKVTSLKCGSHVAATVCPGGYDYGPVHGKKEFGYSC